MFFLKFDPTLAIDLDGKVLKLVIILLIYAITNTSLPYHAT